MVRNYQPRLDKVRGDKIKAAITYHRTQGASQRETCVFFGLTRSLFQKYLKYNPEDIPDECRQGSKPVFTEEQEQEILSYVHMLANRFYAITRKSLGELAYVLAERNGIDHPFKNGTAGNGWVNGFLNRHEELSLRTGTPTSLARITEFNREAVYRFFDMLQEIVSAKGFKAETIYNMDEAGLTIVPSKQPKRIARRGIRTLPVMVPVERGRLCTIVCSLNAAGGYVPPMFIFPGNAQYINMTDAPPNSIYTTSARGWSTTECFLTWLKHFRRYAGRSRQERVLLIVDNYASHISFRAVRYCRKHNIELLSLPPYSTHRMQPCDVGLFSPLKGKYSEYLLKWLVANPFRKPRMEDIPSIFGPAYLDSAKEETAKNAFRKTGIWQFNPETDTWGPNKHTFDEEFDELESQNGSGSSGNDFEEDSSGSSSGSSPPGPPPPDSPSSGPPPPGSPSSGPPPPGSPPPASPPPGSPPLCGQYSHLSPCSAPRSPSQHDEIQPPGLNPVIRPTSPFTSQISTSSRSCFSGPSSIASGDFFNLRVQKGLSRQGIEGSPDLSSAVGESSRESFRRSYSPEEVAGAQSTEQNAAIEWTDCSSDNEDRPSADAGNQKKRKRRQRSRQCISLVPNYSDSSEDEADIEYDLLEITPDRDVASEILSGTNEHVEEDDSITVIVPSGSQSSKRMQQKAFNLGPTDIMGTLKFPTDQTSGRKPRQRRKAEHMTSDETYERLLKRVPQAQRESSSSESDGEDDV